MWSDTRKHRIIRFCSLRSSVTSRDSPFDSLWLWKSEFGIRKPRTALHTTRPGASRRDGPRRHLTPFRVSSRARWRAFAGCEPWKILHPLVTSVLLVAFRCFPFLFLGLPWHALGLARRTTNSLRFVSCFRDEDVFLTMFQFSRLHRHGCIGLRKIRRNVYGDRPFTNERLQRMCVLHQVNSGVPAVSTSDMINGTRMIYDNTKVARQLRTARSKCSLNDHQSLFTSARDTIEPNEFLVYSVLIKGNPSQEPSLLSTFPRKFLKSSARSYKRAFLRPQSTEQSLFSRYNFRLLSMNRWIIGPEKSKNRGLRSEHVRQRNPRYSQPCFAT